MSVGETLPEERAQSSGETAHLLTYVLSYEDLLTDATVGWRLDQRALPVTLGRAADERPAGWRTPTELRLADRWLSGDHARIERRGGQHVVRDLGSRNGTFVNGEPVEERVLADGDLVEVGHSLLCFRAVDAAIAAALEQPPSLLTLGPTRTHCPEVALLLRDLHRIARSRESVLILAETGAGKELAAHAVHALSGRNGAYCPVDCGAVPESLFESTFFGHRRGAFTGASDARAGEIVRADGGTLFLDEVANMSAPSQAKLLRVLEDGKVTPLGAADAQKVDVRWIAATNKELFGAGSSFRADLLRRLAGYVARIPPLRRRREDLGVLSAHLLREAGVAKASLTVAAARVLFNGTFEGNIRQLRTTLRSAALLAAGAPINVAQLPAYAPPSVDEGSAEPPSFATPPSDATPPRRAPPDAGEIEAALTSTHGNVVQAAQLLGTHPRQLYRWIERLALPLDKYRGS